MVRVSRFAPNESNGTSVRAEAFAGLHLARAQWVSTVFARTSGVMNLWSAAVQCCVNRLGLQFLEIIQSVVSAVVVFMVNDFASYNGVFWMSGIPNYMGAHGFSNYHSPFFRSPSAAVVRVLTAFLRGADLGALIWSHPSRPFRAIGAAVFRCLLVPSDLPRKRCETTFAGTSKQHMSIISQIGGV